MGFGSGEGFTPGRNNLVGDFTVEGNISASAALSGAFFFGDGSFLQNVTGSGGAANSIAVGNDVDSGTANRVLYENASNDLAESANLTFDGATLAAGATTVSTLSASSGLTGSSFWVGDTGTGITNTGVVSAHLSLTSSNGITGSSLQISDGSRHYGMTNEGNLGIASFATNWTNAGNTIADLGTVTTATSITATDLIGTNVDGIIGADTARAGTFTTVTADTTVTGSGIVSNIEMPYITASMGALFKRNADNVDQSPLVAISGASGEGMTSDHQASLWVSGSGVNSRRGVVHVESHGPYTISLLTRNDNTNIIYRAGQGLDGSGDRQPKSETNIAFKMAPPADIGGGSGDLSRTWALGVDCQEADYRRFRITNKSGVAITASSDYGFVGTGSLWGFNLNNPAHTLDINGTLCVTGSTILGTNATGSVNIVGGLFTTQGTEATLGDNADALTTAQMLGRLAKITPTTSRSKATPTAAQIVAAVSNPIADQSFDFTVINLAAGGSGNKLTLTAGDGAVTLVGSMELNDASSATFRARLTNVATEAVTVYRIS